MVLQPFKFQNQKKFCRKANPTGRISHDFIYSHIQIFTVRILFTKVNLIDLRLLNTVAFKNGFLHFVQFRDRFVNRIIIHFTLQKGSSLIINRFVSRIRVFVVYCHRKAYQYENEEIQRKRCI
nr:YOR364W [Saccharomyces cerevisiae]